MRGRRVAATCVSGVLTLTLGLGMVGCGNSNQAAGSSAQTQQTESKEEKALESQVLGAKKEGALELTMKNGLGSALTAVSLRASGEQAYQNNLVASGKKVAANEEVRLYVEDAKADAAYDIRVTKEGGGDVEFLAVPVSKIASLTLKEADGKAYVDYVGTDRQNGSTKDATVSNGGGESSATNETPTSTNEAAASTPAPAPAPSAPSQTEDTCVPDVVLR